MEGHPLLAFHYSGKEKAPGLDGSNITFFNHC